MSAAWRLACRNLCVRRGRRTVLHDVSCEVAAGGCVALIGPNGAGKSTLLLTMLGLLRPISGGVFLDGRPVHALSARERGRFAAFVPQGLAEAPPQRVYDAVAGGRYVHGSPWRPLTDADHAAVTGALQRCGLTQLSEARLDRLSGGELQKVMLAAAFAQRPRCLFLDEPDTALDPAYQVELVRLLRGWRADGGAVVLVSHDLHIPAALGAQIVALRHGAIADTGASVDVLTPERLRAVFGTDFEVLRAAGGRAVTGLRWE